MASVAAPGPLLADGPQGRRIIRRGDPRAVQARYDAAQTTTQNIRHWAAADALSADAANSPSVRRTLRNRNRYEIANNGYAKGIIGSLANFIVGTTPRLQILGLPKELSDEIEAAWRQWAAAVHLGTKLRTFVKAKVGDGEAFGLLRTNLNLAARVKLDLGLIEPERVTSPALISSPNDIDGVILDESGTPLEYCVLRQHPGNAIVSRLGDFVRIPAKYVVHWFSQERPEQHRGVPDLMSSLSLFSQLRRFTLATLDAAESAAEMSGQLYTDAPPGGEAEDLEPLETIPVERNMLTVIPGGWKAGQMKPEQPSSTYRDFKGEIINEAARPVHMPFNIAACNSAGYNYSSGNLDHRTFFKSVDIEQFDLEGAVLDHIRAAWFEEAVLVYGWQLEGIPACEWYLDGMEHVDPTKEADAEETELRNHTNTYARIYGKKGLDWETELTQAAKEVEFLKKNNLEVLPRSGRPGPGNNGLSRVAVAEEDLEEILQR